MQLEFDPDAPFTGSNRTRPAARASLPLRSDGSHYTSYADAIADLAPPAVFENRLDLSAVSPRTWPASQPVLRLDAAPTSTASTPARHPRTSTPPAAWAPRTGRHRATAIGDPWDPTRRPINLAISTLTIRRDETTGEATFYLHWRDPAKVAHAAGLYQVVPSGIFQPSADASWNELHDFSLWRNLVRELAEELLGASEDHGSTTAPIDVRRLAVRRPALSRPRQRLSQGVLRRPRSRPVDLRNRPTDGPVDRLHDLRRPLRPTWSTGTTKAAS